MKAKYINCIFLLALIQANAGCSLLSDLSSLNNKLNGGTGSVDATEGDVRQDERGIINALRSREDPEEGDPNWTPIPPPSELKHYSAVTGSLFSLALAEDLYDDTKPRRIGDIVTVLLEENTQAKKAASADTNKSNNLSLNPIELGGQVVTVGGNNSNLSYSLTNDNKTSGSTSADQSNSINGSISVEVVEVLANGNLVIRGEKWLTLNTGDEYIRLSGTVRPDDISPENTIASTRISNAKIRYSATGDRQDIQQESWLARFFNVIL